MFLLSSKGSLSSVFDLLTVLLIFAFTLVLAYLATKFIGTYQKNKGFKRNQVKGNVEVIETYPIAQGKYIQILRVGEKYIAVSVGKEEIHKLTELSEEEVILPKPEEKKSGSTKTSFKDILAKARGSNQKEKNTDQ